MKSAGSREGAGVYRLVRLFSSCLECSRLYFARTTFRIIGFFTSNFERKS